MHDAAQRLCCEIAERVMSVASLVASLRESRGFRHKTDIAGVVSSLARRLPGGAGDLGQAVAVGDDCAALPDGDGYLLFAIEGMVSDFVQAMPWFAGYSSVMVNVSDIYAMGGRPLAVVDALWSNGIGAAHEVLAGMAAASWRTGCRLSVGTPMRAASRRNWRCRSSAAPKRCCRVSTRGPAIVC
jgi:selenophosphate synthetase-related protein